MARPSGPDLSSVGSEELADIIDNFYPDDALLSSLLSTNPAHEGQQGGPPGRESLDSGQAQGVQPLASSSAHQEGLTAATTSLPGQHGALLSASTPLGPGASLRQQPGLPAQQAGAGHAAPAQGSQGALNARAPPSQPAQDPFLLDAAARAAPLGVGSTAGLQGPRARNISRHFEAAAAAVAAEGAGTPLSVEAPEAFLDQLLGADSLPVPGLDFSDAAAAAGAHDVVGEGELAGLVAALASSAATSAAAAAGPAGPAGAGHLLMDHVPAADLQSLGSGSLPPLPLGLDELFDQLTGEEILEPGGAAAAPVQAAGLPAAPAGQQPVGRGAIAFAGPFHSAPAVLETAGQRFVPSPSLLYTSATAPAAMHQPSGESQQRPSLEPSQQLSVHPQQLSVGPSQPLVGHEQLSTAPTHLSATPFDMHKWQHGGAEQAQQQQQPASQAGQSRQPSSGASQQPSMGPYETLLQQLGLQQQPPQQLPTGVAGQPRQPSAGSQQLSASPHQASAGPPPKQQQPQQRQPGATQAVAGAGPLELEQGPSSGNQASEAPKEAPTKKQLRARQAQKRFREKQKAKRQGMEEGVETAAAEMERERALRDSVQREHGAMEQLLGYKEGMVQALEEAGEGLLGYKEGMVQALEEAREGEEVPPAQPIQPVLRPHTEQGYNVVFPVDAVQRYQVEGDTARRDAQGRLIRAPAFEKVAAEFAHIVLQLRGMLGESRKCGDAVMQRIAEHSVAQQGQQPQQERESPRGGWRNVLAYAKRCRLARAGVAPLVPGGDDSPLDSPFDSPADSPAQPLRHASVIPPEVSPGEMHEQGTDVQGAGAPGAGALQGESASAGAVARVASSIAATAPASLRSSGAVSQTGSRTVPPAGGGRGKSPLAGGAGRALAALGLTQRSEALAVQPELALRVASATLATTRTLREGSALSMDAQELMYLETLLRRLLVSTTLRGAQPWTLVEGGLLTQEREGSYFFTGAQLRRATRLVRQAGSLLWQQALLFPDNLLKLSAVRIDTGQPIPDTEEPPSTAQWEQLVEHVEMQKPRRYPAWILFMQVASTAQWEQLVEHAPSTAQWEQLVEHLDLLPSQLTEVVAMHADFIAAVLPARRRRRELLESLMQVQFKGLMLGLGSAQEQAHASLASLEINGHIQKATQEELAAYVAFVAGMIRMMHFPVQKAKLILYSWPYFPQMHLIAQAVRQKLGMEPLAVR
ncbi:hypothetical protein N2152v2_010530 [Parachlorella kessleri]